MEQRKAKISAGRWADGRIAGRVARHAIAFVPLSLAAGLLSWEITRPWVGYQSTTGAEIGIMARNYLRYGYIATKLGPVTNVGPATPREFRYYTHHPVMLPLLMSLSYRIFGTSEASARLIPIVFTLAGLVIWYGILLMHWDRATAVLGLLFLSLVPMTTFFGSTIIYEPLALFFVLATLWCYLFWVKNGSVAAYRGTMLSVLGGTLSDWLAYFIVPFLVLHRFLCGKTRREELWKVLGLPLVAIVGFVIFLAHLWTIGGWDRLLDLSNAFATRSFVNPQETTQGILTRAILNLAYGVFLFTPIVLVLSGIWVVRFGRKLARREPLGPDSLVVLLLGFGLVHVIVFGHGPVHAYWFFSLGPFVAISAALATGWLYRWTSGRGRGWAVAGIVVVLGPFAAQAVAHTWSLHTFLEAEHTRMYRLGLWIKDNTSTDTRLLVLVAGESRQHYLVDYYAERNLMSVGTELAWAHSLPELRSLLFRNVIVPVAGLRAGVAAGLLPCNWPPLEGYACFEISADEDSAGEKNDRDTGRTAAQGQPWLAAQTALPNSRIVREGPWEAITRRAKTFLDR